MAEVKDIHNFKDIKRKWRVTYKETPIRLSAERCRPDGVEWYTALLERKTVTSKNTLTERGSEGEFP